VAHDASFAYPGDLEMARLLAEVACPRSLGECHALLRGAVAAQKTPLPSVLVRELFLGREPRFRNLAHADRFVAGLFGLMAVLHERFARAQAEPAPRAAAASSPLVGTLEDRAVARYAEVRAFLRGLDLGATDPTSLDETGRAALRTLTEASAYLGAMSGLARTDAPQGAEAQELTERSLLGLEELVVGSMAEIELSLRQTRGPDGERLPGTGVGINDLCACGSGKPHRRCCGAPA
jgi:hypothetical protein